MDIINVLEEIKKEEEIRRENSAIHRTLGELIKVEKEAIYGVKTSNKTSTIDRILERGFERYKEEARK